MYSEAGQPGIFSLGLAKEVESAAKRQLGKGGPCLQHVFRDCTGRQTAWPVWLHKGRPPDGRPLRVCLENLCYPVRTVPAQNRRINRNPCFCRVLATGCRSPACRPPPGLANFGTASASRRGKGRASFWWAEGAVSGASQQCRIRLCGGGIFRVISTKSRLCSWIPACAGMTQGQRRLLESEYVRELLGRAVPALWVG